MRKKYCMGLLVIELSQRNDNNAKALCIIKREQLLNGVAPNTP